MEQSVAAKATTLRKKRRLTIMKKNTDPIGGEPVAAEAKAAPNEQLCQATQYKNLTVEYMARKDVVGIKDMLAALEAWEPSPWALRASGFPIVFHDIKFWEDAKVSERAAAFRSKFRKVMKTRVPARNAASSLLSTRCRFSSSDRRLTTWPPS